MTADDLSQPGQIDACVCLNVPIRSLTNEKCLGMDEHYAEVSLLVCPICGRDWLRYFYEMEAFTASGRWYLGTISAEQAALVAPQNAKAWLESLEWYFYGGSYFNGRTGKTSGTIFFNP